MFDIIECVTIPASILERIDKGEPIVLIRGRGKKLGVEIYNFTESSKHKFLADLVQDYGMITVEHMVKGVRAYV